MNSCSGDDTERTSREQVLLIGSCVVLLIAVLVLVRSISRGEGVFSSLRGKR